MTSKMKFKLNSSPHLRMHEITKKLFNLNFLSDIQFLVDDKVIYAHSLELMKRSVVFENKLDNDFREQKLIPITDCKYEVFLEFIRFIYTDDCKIDDDNGVELLKLAVKYQIIMLENLVINSLASAQFCLQLFNHCVINKYDIARQYSIECFRLNYGTFLKNPHFLSLHSDSVNEALQFDQIEKGVTEIQIFDALEKWLVNYGKNNQITIIELRERFIALIKNVRFPLMTSDEVSDCVKLYPEILTENNCVSISKQNLVKNDNDNVLWSSKQRGEFPILFEWRKFDRGTTFKTKFTVGQDIILHGLWVGIEWNRKEIEIEIMENCVKTNQINKEVFVQSAPLHWSRIVTCLGGSIHLRPGFEYTITINYLDIDDKKIKVRCRYGDVDLIYNNHKNCIQILEAGENMVELLFKSIENRNEESYI